MKNYKASILAVTLMIMSVITVIALSVSLVAIRQKESALNLGKSNAAFQNAESGTERALQQIRNVPGETVADIETASLVCNHATGKLDDSAGSFSVELKKDDDSPIHCENDKTLLVSEVGMVKSTGIGSNQDSRAVEAVVAAGQIKFVGGKINANGTIALGNGFTVSVSGHAYTITFDSGNTFTNTPVVVCEEDGGNASVRYDSNNSSGSKIVVTPYDGNGNSVNRAFNFLAIGY